MLAANDIDFVDDDISHKRSYSCTRIYNSIKKRHQTKNVESISLNTLKEWILQTSSLTINEEVVWYEIIKTFFDNLRIGIEHYNISVPTEREIVESLNHSINSLEKLSVENLRKLLSEHLIPHKKIDNKNLRNSAINFIDDSTVKNVIQRAIKTIKISPIYKSLQYIVSMENNRVAYQLTVHNDNFQLEDRVGEILFQKHCEIINDKPISKDVDYFVTNSLEQDKEEVKKHLINVAQAPSDYNPDNDPQVNLIDEINFGFKKISTAINELNI